MHIDSLSAEKQTSWTLIYLREIFFNLRAFKSFLIIDTQIICDQTFFCVR